MDRLTISQLNRIGERLRRGPITENDLRVLEDFRLSFQHAYERVFARLKALGLSPSGRPQKTTLSIIAKLNREKTRLSRMQDIAGCRVIVDSTAAQDKVVDDIRAAFPGSEIYDRRKRPSHGYRAVHVIVKIDGVAVEVQVRTVLQHGWAELSEKLSDVLDPSIKYGGGPVGLRKALDRLSTHVMMEESEEENLRDLRERDTDGHAKNELEEKEQRLRERKLELNRLCKELIIALESAKVDL